MTHALEKPEFRVVGLFRQRGRSLATAESCTGGLIASRITDISGASEVYWGGVVAYSNVLKIKLLGVSADTLIQDGAVSAETAQAMAEGARKVFETDLAVAVTGIAGPTGGTPEKPVGLVYIAVAHARGTRVTRNQFEGGRAQVKEQSADKALEMLIEELA